MTRQVFLNVTTDAAGDGVSDIAKVPGLSGLVYSVEWLQGTLAATTDATLEVVNTGGGVDKTVLTLTDQTADAEFKVRDSEHDDTGTALATFALPIISGKLRLTVAQGGNVLSGGCIVNIIEA